MVDDDDVQGEDGRAREAAESLRSLGCDDREVDQKILGTLAFTWATVVLLGGYPTVLRPDDDFWFATTMVFLEAARYVGVMVRFS